MLIEKKCQGAGGAPCYPCQGRAGGRACGAGGTLGACRKHRASGAQEDQEVPSHRVTVFNQASASSAGNYDSPSPGHPQCQLVKLFYQAWQWAAYGQIQCLRWEVWISSQGVVICNIANSVFQVWLTRSWMLQKPGPALGCSVKQPR